MLLDILAGIKDKQWLSVECEVEVIINSLKRKIYYIIYQDITKVITFLIGY